MAPLQPLADALVYGPLMLYQARSTRHKYLRAGLTIAGLGTIIWGLYRFRAELQAPAAGDELAGLGCARPGDVLLNRGAGSALCACRNPARRRVPRARL